MDRIFIFKINLSCINFKFQFLLLTEKTHQRLQFLGFLFATARLRRRFINRFVVAFAGVCVICSVNDEKEIREDGDAEDRGAQPQNLIYLETENNLRKSCKEMINYKYN